jgi:hypothetical protein
MDATKLYFIPATKLAAAIHVQEVPRVEADSRGPA